MRRKNERREKREEGRGKRERKGYLYLPVYL